MLLKTVLQRDESSSSATRLKVSDGNTRLSWILLPNETLKKKMTIMVLMVHHHDQIHVHRTLLCYTRLSWILRPNETTKRTLVLYRR